MANMRWIPWAIAGALALVVAVNGAFAYFAVTSAPGLVTDHPFEQGTGYNRVLDQGAAQDLLGWRGTVRFMPMDGKQWHVVIEIADRSGKPLSGLDLAVHVSRPLGPADEVVPAVRESAPGRYSGVAALNSRGQWDALVAARQGADRFVFSKRVILE